MNFLDRLYNLPHPIDVFLDPVSLCALGLYAALMLWEALAPARVLPRVPGWRIRGLAAFVVYFLLSTYLPMLWNDWLAPYQLIDLAGLGVAGATMVGLLVYEVGAWVYHRSIHKSDFLWRHLHQMHHSAERLDTTGAFYFSPLDMMGWTAVASFTLVFMVGLPPAAATNVALITFLLGIFQHTNVRTPRWLGNFVQRPEQHTVHHARGVHAWNYADLPVIDRLFGTFRNPATFEHDTGFYQGASARLWDMLRGRDVTERPVPGRATPRALRVTAP